MSIVTKSPAAYQDLNGIASHIQQNNSTAAHRFLKAAQQAFDLLASNPLLGQPCSQLRHPEVRVWTLGRRFRNYAVFYRPTTDGVEIIRVLHGARDLQSVFEENKS